MVSSAQMKVVGFTAARPVSDPDCFVEAELAVPQPGPLDVLVRVHAMAVNPVDAKVRAVDPGGRLRVLGFDASGVVEAIGRDVTAFAPGDEVFYAGDIGRQGSNAELQLVHQNIVGGKPASLSHAEAAALPLTSITAWESLFDLLALDASSQGALLIVGASGGVGSMAVQLARQRTKLVVVGTASRPESADWVRSLGAHHVVGGRESLVDELLGVLPDGVDFVLSMFSQGNVPAFARVLKPRGHVVAVDSVDDINPLKSKSLTWHWELMFARPTLLPDDDYQRRLLDEVATMVDLGDLRTTVSHQLEGLSAASLREAHRLVETSETIGKIVITA